MQHISKQGAVNLRTMCFFCIHLYFLHLFISPPCFMCLLFKSCSREGEEKEQEVESFEVSDLCLIFLRVFVRGLTC